MQYVVDLGGKGGRPFVHKWYVSHDVSIGNSREMTKSIVIGLFPKEAVFSTKVSFRKYRRSQLNGLEFP